jgi:tRNA threonylcarbamoyladenosine biosynthesis protein TsaE
VITCHAKSLTDTADIAAACAALVRARDVVVLAGEMGAGKTAFTVALCRALGVNESDAVSSPTFTLVHSYSTGRVPVVHADLYRLTTMGEIEDLGLREQADLGALVLVEWGDVAESLLGDTLSITLQHDDDEEDARTIVFSVEGHQWDTRWDRLRQGLSRWVVA